MKNNNKNTGNTVYLDHAATTFTDPVVLETMLPYFTENFGNPSSPYNIAHISREALDKARQQVADAINADTEEIYFTSGGTESDNWAIKGVAFANRKRGNHIITSAIEHHAVLHTCQWLEKQGFEVTYLPVDKYGQVRTEDVKRAIRGDTILISVMLANNEIGTIQPIPEIGRIARKKGIYFHTDAVQGIGQIPVDVEALNVDLLSLSSHKFYGPKGVGALYIKKGSRIDNHSHGGAQEKKKRAGTENVPGIVGMGAAIEQAISQLEEHAAHMKKLRTRLLEGLLQIPATHLAGHPEKRLPNNVNVIFEYIEGESILLMLNSFSIAASTGSACTSASLEPSHVLIACGFPHEIAHGSLRLTLGKENTEDDVDYVLQIIEPIIKRLRAMSPMTPEELRK
ncbi:cysteine desulfurase NifS [Methanohalophilus mahii]|uniref:Cysteine desulfurase IscS n=1 Tax=Methanohalophilus mahii (strain ATCC 35705 / DSM 5219 / SLP) TaxID=547558 RepID=D5E9R3_METMS|nr:cysteine desulfurase NifS [Methanohalophilus mahii]ADE35914.1 cysteine desulfurase NifS [Methanohalophilus mahii DSM 5219]